MNDHIGDTNEMSDTPISDSTPHNVADLGMQIRRLERELNEANERIKQLEESENRMLNWLTEDCPESVKKQLSNAWMKSKAKP